MTSEDKCKEMLEDRLELLRSESAGRTTMVRLNFTGRGPLHSMLQSGKESNELLLELQRQETERISAGTDSDLDHVVWPASFKMYTGMDYDKSLLHEENSFLGELLRLSGRSENCNDALNAIIDHALAPLLEHRALRGYVQDLGEKERRELLQQATEMAVSLLVDEEPRGGEVS
ncbi:hypothetical protein D3C80_1371270 [compost metagenome]